MSVLDALSAPRGWRSVPFGRVAMRTKESERPELPPLSVFLGAGVVPRDSREDNHNQLGEDLGKYLVVRPGDLVFNKLRTWQGGLGASQYEGIVSPAYFVCRPTPDYDSRFLQYLLLSDVYLQELTRVSKWQPPSQFDIGWEQLRAVPIVSPEVSTQRAIADYLDTETARIDTLIAKKQRMTAIVAEWGDLAVESALARRGVPWPSSLEELETASTLGECRVIRLSQCLDQLTNGYVGPTRDILVENGIRYVQSLHIKGGRIDFDRRPFFVTPEWHAERPRIHLRENDVLIVQTGDIGQVAVVPPGFGEASCHALQIARVRSSVVLGPYLAEYLRSSLGYQSLLSRATGALHPHLEGGIRTVPVVVPSLQVQREVIQEVAEARRHAADLSARLALQIDLLREHRQAIITAAVTGELEIPGVAA